jgi:hypothetical protein
MKRLSHKSGTSEFMGQPFLFAPHLIFGVIHVKQWVWLEKRHLEQIKELKQEPGL